MSAEEGMTLQSTQLWIIFVKIVIIFTRNQTFTQCAGT